MILKDNPLNQCNLKFDSDGDFKGYLSVFNSEDQVNDTILPGAFLRSLSSGRSVKMFVNHNHREIPIGTWKNLEEDEYGLKAVGSINLDHINGKSLHSAMKRGDMDGLSIGFEASNDDFEQKSGGGRVYKNLTLREGSVVTFPCEQKAVITGVKFDELQTVRDLERAIRDEFGCSKSVACNFVSHAKRILSGELPEYEKQIIELKSRLQQYQMGSLIKTLQNIGD